MPEPAPDESRPAASPSPPAPSFAGPWKAWAAATDADFRALLGRVPGLWAIDKPGGAGGPTSHDIVARARRAFGLQQIGHAGTLDPLASGLLLLLVGRATRLAQYLEGFDKSYAVELLLGRRTDTFDITGRTVAEAPVAVTRVAFEAALAGFRGRILQTPPAFSALKRGGEPLYRKARRGEAVAVEPRAVEITRLSLVGFDPPAARLSLDCSKGTYVRSLAEELGLALGCGACVAALRRTRVGPFTLAGAISLEELERRGAAGELPKEEA